MTHIQFTLKAKEIQNLIDQSVNNDISKKILQTVFNQLMEKQRTEYTKQRNMNDLIGVKANSMVTTNEVGQLV